FHFVRQAVTIGVLVAFMQYAQRFFRPIQDLSEKYNILQSAMAAAERVFKLLDTPVEIREARTPKKPEGLGRIEFDHVWFAYRNVVVDGSEKDLSSLARPDGRGRPSPHGQVNQMDWVLRDVTFTI